MMLLSVSEGEPTSYPALPATVSGDAVENVPAAAVWQRLEHWMSWRWNEREVVWVVQGPGEWVPPLRPATVDSTEGWNPTTKAWESVTLEQGPIGYTLDDATYRITATVGDTEIPPANVLEAVVRLAEYMYLVQQDPTPGHTRVSDGDYSFDRSANWVARALQYSGAADLLRGYR